MLNGPNFGMDPNAGTRSAEAIIDVQATPSLGVIDIGANNVTVDGFTVQNALSTATTTTTR
ncbi:MAG TPA: hypothetical protein VHC19_12995 [Pirellulales bacterium]|nr:hypothetical protein [Pirellulales bacterium]